MAGFMTEFGSRGLVALLGVWGFVGFAVRAFGFRIWEFLKIGDPNVVP